LHRWRTEPAFAQRFRDLQAELLRRAVGRLSRAMPQAAAKLRELLSSDSEKIQLAAAGKLLEAGLKMREGIELEQRVKDLERQRKEDKP
jgi:hypothetical protein